MKKDVKMLREQTGAGILECNRALLQFNGDMEKAKEFLLKKMGENAAKKAERDVNEGMIAHYIHSNKKIGSMIVLKCETDFVAKNALFQKLANDIAMQVVATDPTTIDELKNQVFVKDNTITIGEYINQTIGVIGENIVIDHFMRFSV